MDVGILYIVGRQVIGYYYYYYYSVFSLVLHQIQAIQNQNEARAFTPCKKFLHSQK